MGWWELLAWLKRAGVGVISVLQLPPCDLIPGLVSGNVNLIQNDYSCPETMSTGCTMRRSPSFLLWGTRIHEAADSMGAAWPSPVPISLCTVLGDSTEGKGFVAGEQFTPWQTRGDIPGLQQSMDRQGRAFPKHIPGSIQGMDGPGYFIFLCTNPIQSVSCTSPRQGCSWQRVTDLFGAV